MLRHDLHTKCTAILIAVLFVFSVFLMPAGAARVLLGDLNADGAISAADARLALRLAVGAEPMTRGMLTVGDVNGSGTVTAADARLILRCAVGLEDFGGETVEAQIDSYAAKLASLPSAVPAAPVIDAPSGTFTFVTYGYGHCVGMQQLGAIMMAEAGIPYDYILSYYFSGTTLAQYANYPASTYYAGEYIDTEELLARIVYQEIGGSSPAEALKAQAVAVFTLLISYDFHVDTKYTVGYAIEDYSRCSETLRAAVHEVIGQYVVMAGDSKKEPVLTVYGAMAAGRTLNCSEVWGGDFPVSVNCMFEASRPEFIATTTVTAEKMRSLILEWDSSVTLSSDPAQWLVITSHDASLDADRGYVKEMRIGDKTLSGISAFGNQIMYLRSPCFTVTYTP